MSEEVRIGSLRLKFLIDAPTSGKLTMFDIAAVVNAGGSPDMAKVKVDMERYGRIAA